MTMNKTKKQIVNYRPREYFINILNNIKFDEIQTLAGHYQYLLLSLLVYQPPLRTSVYITTKLITKKDKNDDKHNFLWITKRGSLKVYYIVNDDNVSGSKKYAMNKELSIIKIDNKKLCEIINEAFIKYPQTYLFEINEKQITQDTLSN